MGSMDYKMKFTGCVHSNGNQGVYLIAPNIVNKLNTTANKVFNILFSFAKASQLASTECNQCKDVNVVHVNVC